MKRAAVEKDKGFADPVRFLEFAKERGANAVQLPLGIRNEAASADVRRACEKLGMQIEGIVAPPNDAKSDLDRFAADLKTAQWCGAPVVRVAMRGGRRYEVFDKAEDFSAFIKRAEEAIRRAEPIAKKHKVVLAVENHKDFRTDELVDLMKTLGSNWVGVCVDTGNNFALLEDPMATIEALAPFARSVHLKNMGLEDAPNGFRMSEVALEEGCFDLKKMVAVLRKANPKVGLHLEMITRDPLSIPCLTEKYWATLGRVPGRELARTLARVRATERKEPLPRIAALKLEDQLAAEDRNVRASFAYASKEKLIPG
jgi:sugar phosphate isomerase/epimerase